MVTALLIGSAVSVLLYSAACWHCRKFPEVIACIEAILLGAGVPSGFHLMYGAFAPASIVDITYQDGRHFDLVEHQLVVHLGEYHAVEIFMGGFVGALFCIVGLATIVKGPYRATSPKESKPESH